MNFRALLAGIPVLFAALVGAFLIVAFAGYTPYQRTVSGDAVVMVSPKVGHGSGVHLGNGIILTAAHVVTDEKQVTVDRDGVSSEADVLWSIKSADVALVRVTSSVFAAFVPKAPLADRRPVVGEEVQAVGYPLNIGKTHTWGHVTAEMKQRIDWDRAFIIDAGVAPGMSGGALFDRNGYVLGINVAGYQTFGGAFNFSVPSKEICELLGR